MRQGTAFTTWILLAGCPGLSFAQETIEDVVVTARRQESSLQQTSISVTALSAEQLQSANIQDTRGLAMFTPNLNIGGDGQLGNFPIVLRGIGNADTEGPSQDAPVAVYVDGVYYSRPYQNTFALIDIDRVEVLRGPQGTLFGRNAAGGALQFITKQPHGQTEGEFSVSTERFGSYFAQGYYIAPIGDAGGFKLAGGVGHVGGTATNRTTGLKVNEEDSASLRGSLRLAAGESTDLLLAAYFGNFEFDGGFNNPALEGDVGPDDFAADGEQRERRRWSGASATLTKKLAWADWVTIAAYNEGSSRSSFDSDSTSLSLVRLGPVELESNQYSLESRLASHNEGRVNWIGGAYLFRENGTFRGMVNLGSDLTGAPGEIPLQNFDNEAKTESFAVFGEAYFAATERITLSAGARWSRDDKSYIGRDLQLPNPLKIDASKSWSEVTPRATVDFRATDDLFFYGSVSKGFRSGTWTLTADDPSPANPETVLAYEVGVKSDLANRKVRLNLAAFHYDYKDKQERVLVTVGVSGARNAATATVTGGEAEFTWYVSNALKLFATAAVLDAHYDTFVDPFSGVVYSGNDLIRAPDFQASAIAEYSVPLASRGSLTLRGEYAHQAAVFFTPENTAAEGDSGFDTYNLRATWTDATDRWRVTLYGQNLSDERHKTAVQNFDGLGLGNPTSYARPRTYGVSVGYGF